MSSRLINVHVSHVNRCDKKRNFGVSWGLLPPGGFGLLQRIHPHKSRIATSLHTDGHFLYCVPGAILVASLAFAVNLPGIKALSPVAFGWFALMGAMAYPLARVLVNAAITMVGASRAASMNSLQPVFALGLAVALLGERPNLVEGLGTLMVVCGLALVGRAGGQCRVCRARAGHKKAGLSAGIGRGGNLRQPRRH